MADIDITTEAVERAAAYCENRTIGMGWCGKLIRALAAERDAMSIELRDESRHIRKLNARFADLEAIVERLPKTADGVPVVVGQNVWATSDRGTGGCGVVTMYASGEERDDGRVWATVRDGDGEEWMLPVCNCYSTKDAARAAAKGNP